MHNDDGDDAICDYVQILRLSIPIFERYYPHKTDDHSLSILGYPCMRTVVSLIVYSIIFEYALLFAVNPCSPLRYRHHHRHCHCHHHIK